MSESKVVSRSGVLSYRRVRNRLTTKLRCRDQESDNNESKKLEVFHSSFLKWASCLLTGILDSWCLASLQDTGFTSTWWIILLSRALLIYPGPQVTFRTTSLREKWRSHWHRRLTRELRDTSVSKEWKILKSYNYSKALDERAMIAGGYIKNWFTSPKRWRQSHFWHRRWHVGPSI